MNYQQVMLTGGRLSRKREFCNIPRLRFNFTFITFKHYYPTSVLLVIGRDLYPSLWLTRIQELMQVPG